MAIHSLYSMPILPFIEFNSQICWLNSIELLLWHNTHSGSRMACCCMTHQLFAHPIQGVHYVEGPNTEWEIGACWRFIKTSPTLWNIWTSETHITSLTLGELWKYVYFTEIAVFVVTPTEHCLKFINVDSMKTNKLIYINKLKMMQLIYLYQLL